MKASSARFARYSLIGLALAGSLMAGMFVQRGVAANLRNDIGRDRREIQKNQWKLQRDIQRHGYNSRQAQRDRDRLRREHRDIRNDRRVLNRRYGGRYWDDSAYGYRHGRWDDRAIGRYHRGDGDHDRDDR